ncbi:MAG: hypothetical protein A3E38_02025 [Candidatus Moranbacteria bacterium RIFCSPHIGHO2_12_FULL_54_9]|nr:MAG: hypothetical protein A3E38_02025 [Candidatus Moranbacteria bacterium RIFCSPHIGHO2_12_FULL_54_9]
MPSPYQEFVRKAKERFEKRQKASASGTGAYRFTLHSQYKMQQYGLSAQRVKSVIRNPKRREEGIMPNTVAVMQPVSIKRIPGKPGRLGGETWKQEIWVMFIVKNQESGIRNQEWGQKREAGKIHKSTQQKLTIISAWRYPGISPKRSPIPEEILRELEEGSILEIGEEI